MSRRRKWIALGVLVGLIGIGVAVYFPWGATPQSESERPVTADETKERTLAAGMKLLDQFFKAEADMKKPKVRDPAKLAGQMDQARDGFNLWMERSVKALGVDLRTKPLTVIEMMDRARIKYLDAKLKKGKIDYIKIRNPRGMERHEYAVIVPRAYDPKAAARMPLVVSMHGRVIKPKHPAFKSAAFNERSRQVIWNNWRKSPTAAEALIIAPTGNPNGFTFDDEHHFSDLTTLYQTLGEALTNYRVDWNRAFLEVEGEAMRVVCEQTFMFAGFIVRDRVDNRLKPIIPKEQWFMFENLNGVPLIYIADQAHWGKVGEPLAKALKKAYKKAKAPQNLLVLQAQRDVDDALRADPQQIRNFIVTHTRMPVRKDFRWRFFRKTMAIPIPFDLDANVSYDVSPAATKASLRRKAGSMNFEAKTEMVKGEDGKEHPENRLTLNITEAEGCVIYLQEGLIDFDHPVTLKVNGDVIIDRATIKRDWDLFWNISVPRRFFMIPYLGRLEAKFEHVPKYRKKKKKRKKPKDEDKPKGAKGK